MNKNLHDMLLVARYERKIVGRSFTCILLTLLIAIVTIGFHLLAHTNWENLPHTLYNVDVPAMIPYTNAYLFGVLQAFAVLFLAGDFFHRESRISTNAALWIRPVSNGAYVAGKSLAILEIFIRLDAMIVVLTALLHIFATPSSFAGSHYLFYFLTLTLPALFFCTVLTVCVKSIVRTPALALLLLLLWLAVSFAWLPHFLHGAGDFMATRLPNIFSPMAGHPALGSYLLQRLFFVTLSVCLLLTAVKHFDRPTETSRGERAWRGVCLLASVLILIAYTTPFAKEREKRKTYRATYRTYDPLPKLNTLHHDVVFQQTEGERLRLHSTLLVENRHPAPIDTLLFYLNPDLEVKKASIEGQEITFKRYHQLLLIPRHLSAGGRLRVQLEYEGKLDRAICYPEIADDLFQANELYSLGCFGKKFFFTKDAFTLLTPESMWYPVTLPTVNVRSPWSSRRDFTTYTLKVVNPEKQLVHSQGEMSLSGDTVCFQSALPLAGITLVKGDLARETFSPGKGVAYIYAPHAENCSGVFTLSDEVRKRCGEEIKKAYAFLDVVVPLSSVEVPISFHTFTTPWREGTDYAHPEVRFNMERRKKAINLEACLARTNRVWAKIGMSRTPDDERITQCKDYMLYSGNFQSHAFFSWLPFAQKLAFLQKQMPPEKNKYDLSHLKKGNTLFVSSGKYPLMNFVFNNMIKDLRGLHLVRGNNKLNDYPAVEHLERYSLAHIFQSNNLEDALAKAILQLKGEELRARLLCVSSVDSLNAFVSGFKARHLHQEVAYERFCKEFQEHFAINIDSITERWYHAKGVASYELRDLAWQQDAKQQLDELSFNVQNKGDADGILSIECSHIGPQGFTHETVEHIIVEAKSCKEVTLHIPMKMGENYMLYTNLSKNMPGYKYFPQNYASKRPFREKGIREINPSRFASPEDEIVVDNEDEGFVVKEEGTSLANLKNKKTHYQDAGAAFTRPEWRWTPLISKEAFGGVVQSFHAKAGGNGKTQVEWNATIPQAGTYDLFIYSAPYNSMMNWSLPPKINYSFHHDGLEEKLLQENSTGPMAKITLTLQRAEGGQEVVVKEKMNSELNNWIPAGRFELSAGKVKLVLQDKGLSPGQYLTADAVKWVKVRNTKE